MKVTIPLLVVLLSCITVNAQVDTDWTWTDGGANNYIDRITSVVQLDDGSIIAVGAINSNEIVGQMDGYLAKFTSEGTIQWWQVYDLGGDVDQMEYFNQIKVSPDGGFIITGGLYATEEAWMVRTNSDGFTLWSTTASDFNDGSPVTFATAEPTADGGFLFGGTQTGQEGSIDALIVKVDEDGNEIWRETYGEPDENEVCSEIVGTPNGDFYFAGYRGNAIVGSVMQLTKIDSEGVHLWTQTYDDPSIFSSGPTSLVLTDDGKLVIGACAIPLMLVPRTAMRLVVTDSAGTCIVDEQYSQGPFDNYCMSAIPVTTGGYGLFGHTTYLSGVDDLQRNVYIVRTDEEGDTLWTQEFGEFDSEETCKDAIQTQSGGYLIGGGQFPMAAGLLAEDFLLIQTYPEEALPSELVFSPTELDFGSIEVGESFNVNLQISLVGDSPVTIEDAIFENPVGFDCDFIMPHTMQPSDTLNVAISFLPTGAGNWSGNLWVISDAVNDIAILDIVAHAIVNGVSGDDEKLLPTTLEVSRAFPNPFNPQTSIEVHAPIGRTINAVVYNLSGQEVHRFEAFSSSGSITQLTFDASLLTSGQYFLHVNDGKTSVNQKLIFLK